MSEFTEFMNTIHISTPASLRAYECYAAIRDHLGGKPELVGELVAFVRECREYFDERADAEYRGTTGPVGNIEMSMLTELDALLSRIKEQSNG